MSVFTIPLFLLPDFSQAILSNQDQGTEYDNEGSARSSTSGPYPKKTENRLIKPFVSESLRFRPARYITRGDPKCVLRSYF
jgi:hypothetical protein